MSKLIKLSFIIAITALSATIFLSKQDSLGVKIFSIEKALANFPVYKDYWGNTGEYSFAGSGGKLYKSEVYEGGTVSVYTGTSVSYNPSTNVFTVTDETSYTSSTGTLQHWDLECGICWGCDGPCDQSKECTVYTVKQSS